MGRIVKNIIRIIAFFIIAIPIYLVCDLSYMSPIYDSGIMATILSIAFGAFLTVMAFNFSMAPKVIENVRQLQGEEVQKMRTIDTFKRSMCEVKEDAILILIEGMLIIPLMIFKDSSLTISIEGNAILSGDIVCIIILGFLCNIALAFFDIVLTFLRSFNMVLLLKNS